MYQLIFFKSREALLICKVIFIQDRYSMNSEQVLYFPITYAILPVAGHISQTTG